MINELKEHWDLDPTTVFLNHGSFGATPREVRAEQLRFLDRLESQPVKFYMREAEPLFDHSRDRLAHFVGCKPDNMVFVPNATHGVNAVLRSLRFERGDELIVTDHEYNASRNALDFVAGRSGAKVRPIDLPVPVSQPQDIVSAIMKEVTPKSRLLLIDHITSPTAIVMPLEEIIAELVPRGVEVLVDGAHAPGMIALNIDSLGPTYYAGNCHKWMCGPKTGAFLYVAEHRRTSIRPLVISHGANSSRVDKSRFHLEFDWMGTSDPSQILCLPFLIDFMNHMLPGGWDEIMARNNSLALNARRLLAKELQQPPLCPEVLVGAMVSFQLPPAQKNHPIPIIDPLQDCLLNAFGIEVPIMYWPNHPDRIVRASLQLYNSIEDVKKLASALIELLADGDTQ